MSSKKLRVISGQPAVRGYASVLVLALAIAAGTFLLNAYLSREHEVRMLRLREQIFFNLGMQHGRIQ